MSFVVHLVRHAAFDGMRERLVGRNDAPLNGDGRRQALELAARLLPLGVRAIHTSPQRRARETADVLAARLRLPVLAAPEFDEIDFGDWTGRPFVTLSEDPAWRRFNEQRDSAIIPNGETLEAVGARVRRGLDRIRDLAGPAIVVTHAEIVRGAILMATDRRWGDWVAIDVAPASVVRLAFDGRWTYDDL